MDVRLSGVEDVVDDCGLNSFDKLDRVSVLPLDRFEFSDGALQISLASLSAPQRNLQAQCSITFSDSLC